MIKISKIDKGNSAPCMSCLCDNSKADIYEIKIGKTEQITTTLRLCKDCAKELIKNISIV